MGDEDVVGSSESRFSPELWLVEAGRSGAAAVRPGLIPPAARKDLLDRLVAELGREVYGDSARVELLAAACDALAALTGGAEAEGKAVRARGHVQFARNQHAAAITLYERATELFRASENQGELALTLSGALQSLIYLGRYAQAEAWTAEAEQIFAARGDGLRLARLASNRGNILYRQDRYAEALDSYQRARTELEQSGDARDVASVVSNMATVQISMGRFEAALASYHEARRLCAEAGLTRMAAAADYNIAYLHYLRGDYLRAIEVYRQARLTCIELADQYHEALCDLDEAEMYLELNLSREGARLARRAAQRFAALGMNYERAKAMVSEAVSLHHVGAARNGRALMRQAREILASETNHLWPALIDLYLAISYLSEGQPAMAGRLATSARARLSGGGLPGKSALCDLVRARVRLKLGKAADARALCLAVLDLPGDQRLPSIDYLAWFTLGEVEEQQGQYRAAWTAWQKTREAIERLRKSLGGEDLRISFLKDKVEVYENLVWVWMNWLEGLSAGPTARDALKLVQEAKSRSLADFLDGGARQHWIDGEQDGTAEIRAELASIYRRIEVAMLGGGEATAQVQQMARQAREVEQTIGDRRRERDQALAMTGVDRPRMAGADDDLQSALPANAQLLEYFAVRGHYVAALVTRQKVEFVDLGPVAAVAEKVRLVRFQLSKFRLGPEYLEKFSPRLHDAIRTHLRMLFDELVRPLRNKLREEHLVIAPYGGLHQLPFHALMEGSRCLADDFTISYAPSAQRSGSCRVFAAQPLDGDGKTRVRHRR
jgi:tetratricopeptide (TPR) repeat protein